MRYIVALSGGSDTLITWNNIYRTDLLMARTRLRLGESLACMVYLHRWNCHKHLVFYFITLGFHRYFFYGNRRHADWTRWMGIGSGWTSQNHVLPRNSTWIWKQVERLREMSSCCDQCCAFSINFFFFILFIPEKRHYRPNSLSASTPPTSMCRILSQSRSDCRHRQRPLLDHY